MTRVWIQTGTVVGRVLCGWVCLVCCSHTLHKIEQDAFRVYERGVSAFGWPHVKPLWQIYLDKFVKRCVLVYGWWMWGSGFGLWGGGWGLTRAAVL